MHISSGKFRIIYLLVFISAILIASWRLPAYATRMPGLLLLALTDLYLTSRIFLPNVIKQKYSRNFWLFVSWLPSVLLLMFLFSMALFSPVDWNPVIRTYLLGAVIFFVFIKIPPLLVFLVFDFRRILANQSKKIVAKPISAFWMKISLTISMVIAVVMVFGITIRVYDFEVVEKRIPVHGLSVSFEGYRIVHISDFHLGRWHSERPLQRAIDMANSLEPDLIAFTGDMVNYATSEAMPYKNILAALDARDGVFAVLGNHDYGDYMRWPSPEAKQENIDEMFILIKDLGWTLLENSNLKLNRGNDCLTISGIGHYSTKSYIPNQADFQVAFSGLPDSCNHILLAHTPEISGLKEIHNQSIDLILSGHTHALQLGLHIGSKRFSPASLIYSHWSGLYGPGDLDRTKGYLYVNPGLGHIAFPFRIGIRPEITLLILTNEENEQNLSH